MSVANEVKTEPEVKTVDQLVNDHEALADYTDEQLEAVLNQEQKGDTKTEDPPVLEVKDDKTVEPPKAVDEPKVDGVLAKDGKNFLPFEVLETTRNKLVEKDNIIATEKQEKSALLSENEDLKKQLETLKAEKDTDGKTADQYTEEELLVLDEEAPDVAKILRSQQTQIKLLSDKLDKQEISADEEAFNARQTATQEAIDSHPKIALLQSKGGVDFANAVRIDDILKNDPDFANKTLVERFDEVERLYELRYGVIQTTVPKKELTDAEIKAAADAALLEADKKKTTLRTITDIPGGTAPHVDELAAINDKSGVEMTEQFCNMKTSEEIDAYLNKLH